MGIQRSGGSCSGDNVFRAYKNNISGLRAFLLDRGASSDEIADILQETFAVAWKKREAILDEKAKSYLFTTALRMLYARRREQQRINEGFKMSRDALHGGVNAASKEPYIALIMAERRRWLREQLHSLPARQAQAVRLVHFEGCTR
jgi:RNA polymerase sigma factor (sigma-70 family)